MPKKRPPRRQILKLAEQLRADAMQSGSPADSVVAQLVTCGWLYEVGRRGRGSKALESAAAKFLEALRQERRVPGQHDPWQGLAPRPVPAPGQWLADVQSRASEILLLAGTTPERREDFMRQYVARTMVQYAAHAAPPFDPKRATPDAVESFRQRLYTKELAELDADEVARWALAAIGVDARVVNKAGAGARMKKTRSA